MKQILTKVTAAGILIFFNFISLYAQPSLPAGTKIKLKMDNGVSSESATKGDTFSATTLKAVKTDTGTLPSGTRFSGIVVESKPAATNERPGKLELQVRKVSFDDGTERNVEAKLAELLVGEKKSSFRALSILGGSAIGGIIGLIGGSKGALIGAGVGAGAGTGIALSRKGKEVGIDSDEEFEIVLTKVLELPTEGF